MSISSIKALASCLLPWWISTISPWFPLPTCAEGDRTNPTPQAFNAPYGIRLSNWIWVRDVFGLDVRHPQSFSLYLVTFKKDKKLFFKTEYRLLKVKSIAECSKGPSLSCHLSLRPLFGQNSPLMHIAIFKSCAVAQWHGVMSWDQSIASLRLNKITVLCPEARHLTLYAKIATKVVCFSRLLKCLRSLYGKQCGPSSDCSYRSSLFWVHAVCFYT